MRLRARVAHDTPHLPVGPGLLTGAAALFDLSTRLASPYQLNPLNLNPLRSLFGTISAAPPYHQADGCNSGEHTAGSERRA